MRDILIGGGLALGGASLLGASIYNMNRAKKEASEAFLEAIRDAKKSDMQRRTLDKLRGYADVDVNIGTMSKSLQDSGLKNNAFYTPVSEYDKVTSDLIASKRPGDLGTISIGDDARALPVVAHELGHAKNNKTGRLKTRILWQILGGALGATSAGIGYALHQTSRGNSDYPVMGLGITGGAALGLALGRLIANNAVVDEERDASNNAIEYLKKMRRSKKQLAKDTRVLDKALNTYKTARIWDSLGTIGVGALGGGVMYLARKLS